MASRKEQKERLREERLKREAEAAIAARRRRLVRTALSAAVAGIAVAGIAVAVITGGGEANDGFPKASIPKPTNEKPELEPAARASGCKVMNPPEDGRQHTDGPYTYKSNPPTSGNHNAIPADDGAYTKAPGIGNLVHELEHSRIVIWFRPDASDQVKGQLKALFDEDPYQMVLAPNETQMPYEVAASAWNHSIGCPSLNPRVFDAIRALKAKYRGRGPERVP